MCKRWIALCLCLLFAAAGACAETVSILFPAEDAFFTEAANLLRSALMEKGLDTQVIYFASEDAIVHEDSDVYVLCADTFPEDMPEDAYVVAFLCENERADRTVVMDEYLTGAAVMKDVLAQFPNMHFCVEYAFAQDARQFYLGARDVLQPLRNQVTAQVLCGEAEPKPLEARAEEILSAHAGNYAPLAVLCDSDETAQAARELFWEETFIPRRKDVWRRDMDKITHTTAQIIVDMLAGEGEEKTVLVPSMLMQTHYRG